MGPATAATVVGSDIVIATRPDSPTITITPTITGTIPLGIIHVRGDVVERMMLPAWCCAWRLFTERSCEGAVNPLHLMLLLLLLYCGLLHCLRRRRRLVLLLPYSCPTAPQAPGRRHGEYRHGARLYGSENPPGGAAAGLGAAEDLGAGDRGGPGGEGWRGAMRGGEGITSVLQWPYIGRPVREHQDVHYSTGTVMLCTTFAALGRTDAE